jgi:hypothetical protein
VCKAESLRLVGLCRPPLGQQRGAISPTKPKHLAPKGATKQTKEAEPPPLNYIIMLG